MVYRFSGNVMTQQQRRVPKDKDITFFTAEMRFQSNIYVI